jgi:hypothetical protein
LHGFTFVASTHTQNAPTARRRVTGSAGIDEEACPIGVVSADMNKRLDAEALQL